MICLRQPVGMYSTHQCFNPQPNRHALSVRALPSKASHRTLPRYNSPLKMRGDVRLSRKRTMAMATSNAIVPIFLPPKPVPVKNVLLAGMLFCNLLFYTIVRDMKDVLLVTSCGAEAIPFMKTWVNFPMSVGFLCIFNTLCNNGCSPRNVYRIMYGSIAVMYCFVGGVLFPNRLGIQPHLANDFIGATIANNWVSSLYYALSSVWGSIVISLLFWMTATRYTPANEAKTLYPLFGFVGNIALIAAGYIVKASASHAASFDQNMVILMSVAFGFASLNVVLFEVLTSKFPVINASSNLNQKASSTTPLQGVVEMARNPFIRNMVIIISCYGSTVAMYETVWKYYMNVHFVDPSRYAAFMGTVSTVKGVTTMGMMLASSYIFNKLPLIHALAITPVTISVLGCTLFYAINVNAPPLTIVYLGAAVGVLAKSLKYSFFDPNKEISYMYVSKETRTKGKATIDVLSNPLGKSGSSLALQSMFTVFGSLAQAIPCITVFYTTTCIIWLNSIRSINDTFTSSDPS